ncbi:MAG: permease-like cell division protein FtsX [Parcubacteria group bacterium]|jgi:cell division transport system permease protein
MFLAIGRTFKEALKNLFRNVWLSLATVTILILSLYVVSVLYVVTHSVNNILKDVQSKVNVSVYFKPGVSEEAIAAAKVDLEKNGLVQSVEYVSRDAALENFKRDNADEPIILQSLEEIGENPLLASLVIKSNDPNQYQGIADYVTNDAAYKGEISRINYGRNKEIIDKLNSIIATIRRVGISLGIILAAISILTTFNTIRITIYAQRREIEVMRLVGASNTYIRLPFVFEGVLYGIVASLISMLILFVTLKFVTPYVSSMVPSENLVDFYKTNFPQILGIQLLAGIILGVVSSAIAMRKYLKV